MAPTPFVRRVVAGGDLERRLDALFVNAPLRDYSLRPRVNDFTLPVLGMAYIATYAQDVGFNVAVLDAEAHGLGISQTANLINELHPRWAGFNLLAPTYEISAHLASSLDPDIKVMLGSHHAKAMPARILADKRMLRCEAMILGEAETRVAELLSDVSSRESLPMVMWVDQRTGQTRISSAPRSTEYLAPDINSLPFLDREFLAQDPHPGEFGHLEANMVSARGCPYNCSFCGAAVSANPDITIRTRDPYNLISEMEVLRAQGVDSFRFVDDLFLGARRIINEMMDGFGNARVGDWAAWDATGRINVFARVSDEQLENLRANGLREVALGIESGSERMLSLIDKRIDPDMTRTVVDRLTRHGIRVKGYFILGFPTETEAEMRSTVGLARDLWSIADENGGVFRASAFEFRPYPGTIDWNRLIQSGQYKEEDLLNYSPVDLTSGGVDEAMLERDEFNFSVGIQFSDAPLTTLRTLLVELMTEQHARKGLVA